MKKSKFTEQQIAFAMKQAETGTSVDEVCRKMGISQQLHTPALVVFSTVGRRSTQVLACPKSGA